MPGRRHGVHRVARAQRRVAGVNVPEPDGPGEPQLRAGGVQAGDPHGERAGPPGAPGRGLHSSTSQLNLSRF